MRWRRLGGLFTDEYFYLHCYWWWNWCVSHCQPVFWTGQLWKIEKSSLYGTDFLPAHQRAARRIRTVVQQKDYDCPEHSGRGAGYVRYISENLFSGSAIFIYVQCAVLHVQCTGKITDSVIFPDFFFGI